MNKGKLYFMSVSAFVLLLVFYFFQRSRTPNFQTRQIVLTKIKNKVGLYNLLLDSVNREKFVIQYNNAINQISYSNDDMVIAERMKLTKDTTLIELFTSVLNKKNSKTTYLKSINGVIQKQEYNISNHYPRYSINCNEHYLYFQKSLPFKYDSYSITIINQEKFYDTKIFLSNKFDTFINIQCPCEQGDVKDIIRYIDGEFALLGKDLSDWTGSMPTLVLHIIRCCVF